MRRMSVFMLALLALLIVESALAQTTYPEKPIRIIVGFPPGAQIDTVARLLGQKLAEAWGKPVVIDNISGAAGNIAADRVAKAPPDGYTLGLLGHGQLVINPNLYKVAFDPVKDFRPISQIYGSANILVVHNEVRAKSVKELVALAKAQPGGLTFASAGSGSPPHLAAELFKTMAGVDIRHIPYKGVPAAIPDLLGGRVTMMFSPIAGVLPMVREGKLRALAVTSLARSEAAAEVPTIAEAGYPGFEFTVWSGFVAPTGTPPPIVSKLHLAIVKVLAQPDVRAELADIGLQVIGNAPNEFAAVIETEIPKWAKLIKESSIKPD
jgi:tripartite-type tricarboxylate transporter receptor subunit TctC